MRFVAIAVLLGGFCCLEAGAVNQAAEQAKQLRRKSLAQETQIEGYTCAMGVAWFYADGKLNECMVPRDTEFGVAHIPAGSWINLREDGRPAFVFLQHDTVIAGVKCSGGNWLLGPTEGAMTGFYPSGELRACSLAADQVVQGVPCRHDDGPVGILYGHWIKHRDYDRGIEFYQSGRLKSCGLAADFGGQKKNTLWEPAK